MQLGAGDEHIICGKTVRVNRAGPRPAVHLLSAPEAGRSQAAPPTCSAPLAGGVSRQRGGHSLIEPISLPGLGMQSAATARLSSKLSFYQLYTDSCHSLALQAKPVGMEASVFSSIYDVAVLEQQPVPLLL